MSSGRKKELPMEYCTRCGKEMYRPKGKRRGRPFCSNACKMKTLNAELNPGRMTSEVREKLRSFRLGSGEGTSYEKYYGRHTHRVVAEKILGRPLRRGEVVHHIDGDKRNNAEGNLQIFESQAAHAKWHAEHGMCGGGDLI